MGWNSSEVDGANTTGAKTMIMIGDAGLAPSTASRHNGAMRPQQDTVTSSEIADWVYCQEAWRLRQIGTESANTAQRAAGTAHHSHKAFAEILAGVFIAIGRILILAALLALAALWWLSR